MDTIELYNIHIVPFSTGEVDIQTFIEEEMFSFSEEEKLARELKAESETPDDIVVRVDISISAEGNVFEDIKVVHYL